MKVSRNNAAKIDQLALQTTPTTNSLAYRLSQYLASGDGDWATGNPLPSDKSLFDILGATYTADGGGDHLDTVAAHMNLLSKYIADGDGDWATGTALPSNISLYDLLKVNEATGDADIDIDQADYTTYINCLTVTAPATGLIDCRIDIDFNKASTGWDAVATAGDVLDCVLVVQTDGTNYRSTQMASAQITANGDGSLDASESGVSFHIGPMQANGSVQVHVKMDTERGDCELPYRVTYVGKAPTITPVAAA